MKILPFLCLISFAFAQSTNPDDQTAIHTFTDTFSFNFLGWNNVDDPCTSGFFGITCVLDVENSELRITEIDISGESVGGVFVTEIGLLTKLKILRLSNNQISGNLPEEIGSLLDLEELILDNNIMDSDLPSGLGSLSKLRKLHLHSNQFSSLPFSISGLSSLVELKFDSNGMGGILNLQIFQLSKLEILTLSSNNFFGGFPTNIGNLKNLKILDASGNTFSGSIPSQIYSVTSLEDLILSDNLFSGSIRPDIENLVNLNKLVISNQNGLLSGSLPSNISSLVNLSLLNLAGNKLQGALPIELTTLLSLTAIRLSNNKFSGIIPTEIGDLTNLLVLDLSENEFISEIPETITSLFSLEELDLSGMTDLKGTIPTQMNLLVDLAFLDLSNNNLGGGIPASLGMISSLNSVNLANNKITGQLNPNLIDIEELFLNMNYLECPVLFYGGVPSNDYNLLLAACDSVCDGTCLNGGTCSLNEPGKFTCQCTSEFTGGNCQFAICDSQLVGDLNYPQGVQGDVVSFPCEPGLTGTRNSTCQVDGKWSTLVEMCQDVDQCHPSPCSPNAVCQDSFGGFTCTCNIIYEGDGFTCNKLTQNDFTLQLGPTAYWIFNDTEAVLDVTGNGNDLATHGRPTQNMFQDRTPGNTAVMIDRLPIHSLSPISFGSNFAFSAIFHVPSGFTKSFNLIRLLPSPNSPHTMSTFSVLIAPNGKLSIYYVGNTPAGSSWQRLIQVGRTYHLFVAVRNSNTAAVWVNGVRVGIWSLTFNPGNYHVSLGSNMNGLIDEVAAFNGAFYSDVGFAYYDAVSCRDSCPGDCFTNLNGHVCI